MFPALAVVAEPYPLGTQTGSGRRLGMVASGSDAAGQVSPSFRIGLEGRLCPISTSHDRPKTVMIPV